MGKSCILQVSSEEEYKKLIDLFPETATAKYPIKYPFSPMVLKIYLLFKDYILECKQFVQDMSLRYKLLSYFIISLSCQNKEFFFK